MLRNVSKYLSVSFSLLAPCMRTRAIGFNDIARVARYEYRKDATTSRVRTRTDTVHHSRSNTGPYSSSTIAIATNDVLNREESSHEKSEFVVIS